MGRRGSRRAAFPPGSAGASPSRGLIPFAVFKVVAIQLQGARRISGDVSPGDRKRCPEPTSRSSATAATSTFPETFFTPGSCFRPASAAPRSTSCNGTSACGPGRHSAGSDDTCSDATCSSGDAGPRRTSLAGMNGTDEGTSGRPSSPDGEPAKCAGSRPISVIDHQWLRPERSAVNPRSFGPR